jgi:hypothetical protein
MANVTTEMREIIKRYCFSFSVTANSEFNNKGFHFDDVSSCTHQHHTMMTIKIVVFVGISGMCYALRQWFLKSRPGV